MREAAGWKIDAVPDGGILVCGHPASDSVISVTLFGRKHLHDIYRFQYCDIFKAEHMSSDFLAMNPFHQVPSCKLSDGTCLYESGAILRFLARKFAPETYASHQQVLIDIALDKRQTELVPVWAPIGYYAMQLAGSDRPSVDAAANLTRVLSIMENSFLKCRFIGGDLPCIADYSIAPLIFTLTLSTVKKIGYTLSSRWSQYLADFRSVIGDIFEECTHQHAALVESNETAVEAVEFYPFKAVVVSIETWKVGSAPEDGVLVCGHPASGNVVAVMLFGMHHLATRYKFQMCDILSGDQMSSDLTAINPFQQVPSCKMFDGTSMYESGAILRCLAKKFAPQTYQDDQQLVIDMALDKRQTELYPAWRPIGNYAMQLPSSNKPTASEALKLKQVLSMMSKVFLKGKFVGGEMPCIADYSIAPLIFTLSLSTVKKIGFAMPHRWAEYLDDMKNTLGDVFQHCTFIHADFVESNRALVENVLVPTSTIKDAFHRFDSTGTGTIGCKELAALLYSLNKIKWNEPAVNALIVSMGKDPETQISYDEFVDWVFDAPNNSGEVSGFLQVGNTG